VRFLWVLTKETKDTQETPKENPHRLKSVLLPPSTHKGPGIGQQRQDEPLAAERRALGFGFHLEGGALAEQFDLQPEVLAGETNR